MDERAAWGRVKQELPNTAEDRLTAIWNDRKRYPRWTAPMAGALTRLRKEGRKWFQLYDKIADVRTLTAAWQSIDRRTTGAARHRGAGVDGVTVADFAAQADKQLPATAAALKAGTYQPRPVRRQWLPKPDRVKKRPLGIPTVKDRVVQEAVRGIIEPIWEEQFLDGSHGFRPGRSAESACLMMEAHLETGKQWVVDADITGCFDNITHRAIVDLIARHIADGKVLRNIRAMLTAGVMEEWTLRSVTAGTPQGGVISPLLCNIVLHEMDTRLESEGIAWVRYADDFVLLCETREQAERARDIAGEALSPLGLELNAEKTRVAHLEEGFDFLGWHYKGRQRWPRDKSVKALKQKLRAKTRRNRPGSMKTICKELEPRLKGFYNYFHNGNSGWAFRRIMQWLRRRLRSILKSRRRGHSGISKGGDHFLWPNAYFGKQGLSDMLASLESFRLKHSYPPARG